MQLIRKLEVLSYRCFCMDVSFRFHQEDVVSFLFVFGAGERVNSCSWSCSLLPLEGPFSAN